MGEFDLIRKYFSRDDGMHAGIELGIGDDCALISVPSDHVLAVSTDTFLEGTHFFKGTAPHAIGYKALAVNISDLAAMGASPVGFTLALTLPDGDEAFVSEFAEGLFEMADRFGIPLVGGDTTRGPLSVTVTVMGKIQRGRAIKRSAANHGDAVCVSGPLGGAAYGVSLRYGMNKAPVTEQADKAFRLLDYPNPRMDLVPFLHKYHVHSALDISDGFVGDLGHILEASDKYCEVELDGFPVSEALNHLTPEERLNFALNGGDDYELCFTLSEADYSDWIRAADAGTAPRIFRVGTIVSERLSCEIPETRTLFTRNGKIADWDVEGTSFSHF